MSTEDQPLDVGAETAMGAPKLPSIKWPKVKDWGIGEWGSAASIVGLGLWAFEHIARKLTRR